MPNNTLHTANHSTHLKSVEEVELVDVGEVSDVYASEAERQAVHDAYEKGNEVAAQKDEPFFDNRAGFQDQVNLEPAIAPDHKVNVNVASDLADDVQLNNPSATPPNLGIDKESKAGTNNDSVVAPEKDKNEAMRGFHGG